MALKMPDVKSELTTYLLHLTKNVASTAVKLTRDGERAGTGEPSAREMAKTMSSDENGMPPFRVMLMANSPPVMVLMAQVGTRALALLMDPTHKAEREGSITEMSIFDV